MNDKPAYPPPNVTCLNGRHDRCDGIATRLSWRQGEEPAPECSCNCHYSTSASLDPPVARP